MPQTDYDEELEEDLQSIRQIVEELVAMESIRRLLAQQATKALASLTPEQLSELDDIGKESFEIAKEMAEADQEPYVSVLDFASFPEKLEALLTTELSENALADMRDYRADLIQGLEELEEFKLQLLYPEVKSPYDFHSLLFEFFKQEMSPQQRAAEQKLLKFYAKHEDEMPVDKSGYWEGVATLAFIDSVLSVFLVLILKWVNYSLDDYDDHRGKDWREAWAERFRKFGEVMGPLVNAVSRMLDLIFRIPSVN